MLRSDFPLPKLLDTVQSLPVRDEDTTCGERRGGNDKSQDGKCAWIDIVQDVIDLQEGNGKPGSEYKHQLRSMIRSTHVITRLEAIIIIVQTLFIFCKVSVQHERREVSAFSKSELRAVGIER